MAQHRQRMTEFRVPKDALLSALNDLSKSRKQLAIAIGMTEEVLSRKLCNNKWYVSLRNVRYEKLRMLLSPAVNLDNLVQEYAEREGGVAESGTSLRKLRWSPYRQVVQGRIPRLRHYACIRWNELVVVDLLGTARKRVDATILNTSRSELRNIAPPIYGDPQGFEKEALKPWARIGKGPRLALPITDWVDDKAMGRIRIDFSPAIKPESEKTFSYGHEYPRAFSDSDGWYSCDIATPHFDYRCELRFPRAWKVSNVEWNRSGALVAEEPGVRGSTIYWRVRFPPIGVRLRLSFLLSK